MQKWEYLYIIRIRGWERQSQKSYYFYGDDWRVYIWARGAKDSQEWKGDNLTDLLCELGDQGWELASSHPRSDFLGGPWQVPGGGMSITNDLAGFTSHEVYILKRPKA